MVNSGMVTLTMGKRNNRNGSFEKVALQTLSKLSNMVQVCICYDDLPENTSIRAIVTGNKDGHHVDTSQVIIHTKEPYASTSIRRKYEYYEEINGTYEGSGDIAFYLEAIEGIFCQLGKQQKASFTLTVYVNDVLLFEHSNIRIYSKRSMSRYTSYERNGKYVDYCNWAITINV